MSESLDKSVALVAGVGAGRAVGGVALPIQSDATHGENVGGAIDKPAMRQVLPHLQEQELLKASAIADAFWHLAHRNRSAWSHELAVRPVKERF